MEPLIYLSETPLDPTQIEAHIHAPEAGAILVFTGTARTRPSGPGATTEALFYEAYPSMAIKELRAIAQTAQARWPDLRLALVHRLGLVKVGEPAVVVAVATPHRHEAYESSRFLIEALKAQVPIWKKEVYADGSAWTTNRP